MRMWPRSTWGCSASLQILDCWRPWNDLGNGKFTCGRWCQHFSVALVWVSITWGQPTQKKKSITKCSHRILHDRYLRFRIFPTWVVFVWSWAKCNVNDTNPHWTARWQRQLHCDRAISDYAILHQHRRVVGAQHYDERNFSTQVRVVFSAGGGAANASLLYIQTIVFRVIDSQLQVPIDNSNGKVNLNLEFIYDSSCVSRRSMFAFVRHYKYVGCESNSSMEKWILETTSMECH